MNERIRDLLPNPFAVDYQYKDGPLDLYTEKEMFRFAELIVKECIAWVEDNNGHDGPSISEMKEHFGVEE